jgi:hypothetical protein
MKTLILQKHLKWNGGFFIMKGRYKWSPWDRVPTYFLNMCLKISNVALAELKLSERIIPLTGITRKEWR